MKIKLQKKQNPQNRAVFKYYASPVNAGKKTMHDVARDISGRSSLTRGDIENVLSNFLDCLPGYLRDGFSVQLGEFGTMRLTLSSDGADTEKAFKTGSIKPRLVFTPSPSLKSDLKDNTYETVKELDAETRGSASGTGSTPSGGSGTASGGTASGGGSTPDL